MLRSKGYFCSSFLKVDPGLRIIELMVMIGVGGIFFFCCMDSYDVLNDTTFSCLSICLQVERLSRRNMKTSQTSAQNSRKYFKQSENLLPVV